ncbi:MAG: hypothetical protein Q7J80_02545 [Anaerolineales bacterium]|nr:hypothetical protein [Anaerolineales bacterium]
MQQFQDDLMEAVRDMKAGRAARTHRVPLTPAADARAHAGLSQSGAFKSGGRVAVFTPRPLLERGRGRGVIQLLPPR